MDLFNKKQLKNLREENEELRRELKKVQDVKVNLENIEKVIEEKSQESLEKTKEIQALVEEKERLIKQTEEDINTLEQRKRDALEEMKKIREEIKNIKDEKENTIEMVEMGAFNFAYHYEESAKYEEQLKVIKSMQNDMMEQVLNEGIWRAVDEKDLSAVEHKEIWNVKGSYKKGIKLMKDNDKLLLRAFNNECDNIIINARFVTIDSSKNKLEKSFKQLNKLSKINEMSITNAYFNLKMQELELKVSYLRLKEKEKEEQRAIREQMREDERVRKELESEIKKIEKEQNHFMNELSKMQIQMEKVSEKQRKEYESKIAELQSKIKEMQIAKEDVENKKLNNKAGYVYIISNPSFEGNVFKIGTTRRLDPMERINELSSASVPFKYGVHSMIFSNDAFALENNLHKAFDDKRVNKVNLHKEFFRVSIDEIEEVVKRIDSTVEFKKTIYNEEYEITMRQM